MLRHLLRRRSSPTALPTAPILLDGPWLCGLSLSLHSDGEAHTAVGELLSRYKYAEEPSLMAPYMVSFSQCRRGHAKV